MPTCLYGAACLFVCVSVFGSQTIGSAGSPKRCGSHKKTHLSSAFELCECARVFVIKCHAGLEE